MLYKVFDFADKEVRSVMVPRPEVDAIPVDCTPSECLARMTETQHTRYPIYRASLDDLAGIVNIHDFLAAMEERGLAGFEINELVRPPHVVPETKNLGALLTEFRRTGQQMAIVADEYGSVQGIATLEDLPRRSSARSLTSMSSDEPFGALQKGRSVHECFGHDFNEEPSAAAGRGLSARCRLARPGRARPRRGRRSRLERRSVSGCAGGGLAHQAARGGPADGAGGCRSPGLGP
jgi:CBS domain-containing protein